MEDGDAGLDVDECVVLEGGELFGEFVGEYEVAVLVDLFGGGEVADVFLLLLRQQLLVLLLPLRLLVQVLVQHGSCSV